MWVFAGLRRIPLVGNKYQHSRAQTAFMVISSYNSLRQVNYNPVLGTVCTADFLEHCENLVFPTSFYPTVYFCLFCCFAWLLTSENIPVALSTADCGPNNYFPALYITQCLLRDLYVLSLVLSKTFTTNRGC